MVNLEFARPVSEQPTAVPTLFHMLAFAKFADVLPSRFRDDLSVFVQFFGWIDSVCVWVIVSLTVAQRA